jgi:adenylate cyclase
MNQCHTVGELSGHKLLDTWDDSEVFTDINGNKKWDIAEEFFDDNENGIWDEGELFFDMGNEIWDEGEEFVDIDECEKTGTVCRNKQCVEYKECHDINQNNKWDKGLDVILVEIDDESFRLINEPMPYSRGTIWSRAVKNLTDAGAKVIAIDMVFDKPDHQTENIKNYIKEQKVTGITIEEGDKLLVEAINYANSQGTKVILSGAQKIEPSRFPPDYLLEPTKGLMEKDNNQRFGLVNISVDSDNFYRKYGIFYPITGHESVYYTLGINTVLSYFNVDEKPEFILDAEKGIVHIGPLAIPVYGNMPNEFLLNYSGPASGEYKTFNRYSLSNIVDTEDYYIGESEYDPDFGEIFYFEDQNWMDNIIGPNADIMAEAGFINPFKGKIVVIGTSLAEDQDIKPTPYLTYGEKDHLMPGLEIHANAIQQMLYSDYIDLPFGGLEYNNNVSKYKNIHLVLILVLIIITLLFVSKAPPLWGFAVMAIEVIAWGSYSIGAFLTDQLWLYKLIG